MRPVFHWKLRTRSLELGKRTLIMGVVNVTPDSFADGGRFLDLGHALEHCERLLAEGADIIDIGGESTRPGARVETGSQRLLEPKTAPPPVSAEEELKRVIPVIAELKTRHSEVIISVDTYKAVVARAAADNGADIVNDVSGLRWDTKMIETVAELQCGAVLMHMRGRPEEWRTLPPAGNIVAQVKQELSVWAEQAVLAGMRRESIVLDPGFGFGKSFEENYPLIAHFDELQSIGFPLLAGTSRKSFIGRTLRANERDAAPEERLYGTLASQTAVILKGAHIVRTHDVKASSEAARVADAILSAP